jgi:hypothetical protein
MLATAGTVDSLALESIIFPSHSGTPKVICSLWVRLQSMSAVCEGINGLGIASGRRRIERSDVQPFMKNIQDSSDIA